MLESQIRSVQESLRTAYRDFPQKLESIRVIDLRGISDLYLPFDYPVCVLAGKNATGKTTGLLACACAYAVPGAGQREYTPAKFFPRFQIDNNPQLNVDKDSGAEIIFEYQEHADSKRMRYRKTSNQWNKSFFGEKSAQQPERVVYHRRLKDLSNPSERQSILQTRNKNYELKPLDLYSVGLAQSILNFEYLSVQKAIYKKNEMLVANRVVKKDGTEANYSEFHMSSGERALIRLFDQIGKLENALILIDEIEVGLHPYTQQLLMLQLQRLALRKKNQVIVTTHSPIILEAVPPEARLFLERHGDSTKLIPAYSDVVQKALYGKSHDKLTFLCEDDLAEAIIRGLLNYMLGERNLNCRIDDFEIGRDSSKNDFPNHYRLIAQIDKLPSFVFVLDGDARDIEEKIKNLKGYNPNCAPHFLPGDLGPEEWAFSHFRTQPDIFHDLLNLDVDSFSEEIRQLDAIYEHTTGAERDKWKEKLYTLCNKFNLNRAQLFTEITERLLKENAEPKLLQLVVDIEDSIAYWRQQLGT